MAFAVANSAGMDSAPAACLAHAVENSELVERAFGLGASAVAEAVQLISARLELEAA